MGAVALLLLVACSNVAHLFLARGIGRTREMSVRRALGASTRALVGQLMAEGAVIAVTACAAGLGLAWITLRGFGRWTSVLPRGESIALDPRVVAFSVALALATVLIFGLVPALRATRRDLHDALRSGGRGASASRAVQAFRSGLVVGEVALSLLLVAMAGLFMRSFVEISTQDTGMVAENVYVVPLSIPPPESGEAYVGTLTTIADAVRGVPGVVSATWSSELPFERVGGNSCCWATGVAFEEGGEPVRLAGHSVDEAFFETFRTELVAGAAFHRGETEPVVVVSEGTAIRGWGSARAALGQTLLLLGEERRIVGVAEPTLHYGLDQPHDITAYLPVWQDPSPIPWASVAVRTEPGASGTDLGIREAIWSVAPDLPIPNIRTLDGMIAESTSSRRLGGLLSTSFGFVALLLAAGGLYGTLLYAVGEQRRAIGIRMALGAGKERIERSIVGRAVALGLSGVTLGLVAGWYATRFLEAFLFGIPPRDPVSFAAAAGLLLAVAAAAAWLPARRASRTDPMEALRSE
jgi:predicted permease